jgi:C-terminal processing protease CtpA/Prc
MKKPLKLTLAAGAIALLLGAAVLADVVPNPMPRRGPPQKDMVMDQAKRAEVLERLITELNGNYVFPDQAKAMEAELRAKDKRGEYAKITSAEEFAATLTEDLRRVTKDRHLDVAYSEQPLPPQDELESEAPTAESLAEERRLNFGVERVERLHFNIGYLDLRAFGSPEGAAGKFASAMSLLADTDALVIDLRFNGGGDPATVALLASYLFDDKTRLNDIYERPKNKTTQYWTSNELAGPKYGGTKKVYLLVSHDTFSAGEDFAYALKNLKRATLIGKATGGGAHPGSARRLTDHFASIVPSGRSISPITKTDWEGVGVLPDIDMDPEKALEKAQALYLADAIKSEQDEGRRARMQERLAELD